MLHANQAFIHPQSSSACVSELEVALYEAGEGRQRRTSPGEAR